MTQPPHLDPVAAAVALFAVIAGPALAGVVGPYAVIIVASLVGGGWALSRRTPTTRGSAVLFLALVCGTAVVCTAGLAALANAWLALDNTNILLAPIGLLIGAVGHDWPRVGRWVTRRLAVMVDSWFERRGNGGGGK